MGATGGSGTGGSVGTGGSGTGGSVGTGGSGGSEQLPPMPSQSFLIGYNEAWAGAHFGTDYTTDFDLAYMQKVFDGIVAGGGHLVRLWVWEVPQGFEVTNGSPMTQPVSQAFLDNVGVVLHEARKRGLWVYLTLLDGNTIQKIQIGNLHQWGVNVLNNTGGERDAFNQNAVGPLLGVLEAHKDVMFGLDIINEVQACSQNGVFPDAFNGPRAFLQAEVAFIKSKAPWLKLTSSAGWPSDILKKGAQYDIANGLYSGLGLDFYDLHAYADSGTFVGATAMCQRVAQDGVPIYLGEFGQSSKQVDDVIQYNATAYFLNNAKALCFKGAFAWRFDAAESQFAYVHADFSPRPAVQVMQVFGAAP